MGNVLAKVPLGDANGYIVVEVDDAMVDEEGVALASRAPGAALVEATETLDSSFDRITAVVGGLLERLQSLPAGPERAEVQFGLKLGVEAGLIIARGTAEVNFQVTLSWQRDRG